MKIFIMGAGYVGMAYAGLFCKDHKVTICDNVKKKVDNINCHNFLTNETELNSQLSKFSNNIDASEKLIEGYDIYLICLPTNYDDSNNSFNTEVLEKCLKEVSDFQSSPDVVIKSTVPVGFTKFARNKYRIENLIFSPEFLKEGSSFYDVSNPSRVVIGLEGNYCTKYTELMSSFTSDDKKIMITSYNESESIKLFSNTYLAMRISFFNELDSFCLKENLNTRKIIDGICSDPRIGSGYNNPSFGYGGYCLPKDTKQLLANYISTPQNIISSIVSANQTRKLFLADHISKLKPKIVGIHRLIMKKGSDNYRESSVLEIINELKRKEINILIYEPLIDKQEFMDSKVTKNFEDFCEKSSVILTNRVSKELDPVRHKVFSRDVFNSDI